MQSSSEKKAKNIIELTIKLSSQELEKFRKKAIKEISKNADIKWFRKWAEIPEPVIIKKYGEEKLKQLIIDIALGEEFQKALLKEKVVPVSQAQLKEIKSYDPLEVVLTFETFPEVKIDEKKLEKIKIKIEKTKVTKKDVDLAIEDIEKRFTTFEEVKEWIIENWDKLTLNTQWYDKKDWEAIPETKVEAFPLVIWSKQFIPWFEDKLVGKKFGEKVSFEITFPEDYHAPEFKSKKVWFEVDMIKLEKPKKPEWTPEFIKWLRWKDVDLKWFKEILKEEIKTKKEANSMIVWEEKLLDELIKITDLEIWEWLLKTEIQRQYEEQDKQMKEKGFSIKDYLSHLKLDEDKFKEEQIKPLALKKINSELIFAELHKLKADSIEVTDKEIEEEITKIKSQFQKPEVLDRINAMYKKWEKAYVELSNRLKAKKLVESFFDIK